MELSKAGKFVYDFPAFLSLSGTFRRIVKKNPLIIKTNYNEIIS